jgi:hypothetical protein
VRKGFVAHTSLHLILFVAEEWREVLAAVGRDCHKRAGPRHSLHVFTRQPT